MYDKIEVQVQAMGVDELGAPIPRDVKTKEFETIEAAQAYAKAEATDGRWCMILVTQNGVMKQI